MDLNSTALHDHGARCPKCSQTVNPGTLYCWRRHDSTPPKVGEFVVDHEQLLWRSTDECSGRDERALAVVIDGDQMRVDEVREVKARPARLELALSAPGQGKTHVTQATLLLPVALEIIQDENHVEVVEASPAV